MKTCSKCGHEKDKSEFQKDSSNKDGLHYYCKACRNPVNAAKNREAYANGRTYKTQKKAYYLKNKKRISAYQRQYRIDHKK